MSKRCRSSEVTRRAITDALKLLMTQKPLDKITISKIMDLCGMRRQHFYYYFTDIYDLVRQTVGQVIREKGFPDNAEKEDVAARFLTIAMAGIAESWLRSELGQTPEELIALFNTMFQDYICGMTARLSLTGAAHE